ncbi:MAG: ATPase [Clostridia bacterium]|nr:ATPase [Clostridia bacterium]
MVFLGIDGGGTKTLFTLCTQEGRVLRALRHSSISIQQCGRDGIRAELVQGLRDILSEAGDIPRDSLKAVCLGAPCWGESIPGDASIQEASLAAFGNTPVYICNDSEVACAGSFALGPGINIVAGTGTIAFGMDAQGRTARCGGWGYIADEGSGYWLGMRLISLFCKQADGRLPRDMLYHVVTETFGLTRDFDFIDMIIDDYMPFRDKVAGLQLLLYQAATQGDTEAILCYREAGKEIAQNAKGILSKLHIPQGACVSYSGGIFKAGALVMDSFRETLESIHCTVSLPKAPPWAGALMLALRLAGYATPQVIGRLVAEGATEI